MGIKESEFDKLVAYTLRIELLNGKVLLYRINTENKQRLIRRLRENATGDEEAEAMPFLWFEIEPTRFVIINTDSFARATFCFDHNAVVQKGHIYYDNFELVQKDEDFEEETALEEPIEEADTNEEGAITEANTKWHSMDDAYLPQAIIYHKGKEPDDHYDLNPLTYGELSKGCLVGLASELEGEWPLRQFVTLVDNDGEDGFIPMNQIIAMEFDNNLVSMEDEEDTEGEEESE